MRRVVALLAVLVPAVAHADVTIDWARGLVIGEGVSVADRHAPNPAVARGTARRPAEDAARQAIAAKLGELPVAGGGTVAGAAKDKAVKARLEHAVEAAITLAAEPETDGAWHVTMAVPIEAVRQALVGPRALPASGDAGPPVVVIEDVSGKPAVGWKLGGKQPIEAASLWVDAAHEPAWAKSAPHVKARRVKGGVIDVEGMDASPSTLFVIVGKAP